MLDLLIVRHGQTPWNVERRVMGMRPIGLTEVGKEQLSSMAQLLAPIDLDAIYCSPAKRTRESADILAAGRSIPLHEDEAFAEVDYGDWIGEPFTFFEGTPDFYSYIASPSTFQIPGGERILEMQKRVVAGVERIRANHQNGRVVIVTHADIVKSIIVHYLDHSLDYWHRYAVANGSLAALRFSKEDARLLALNLRPDWEHVFGLDPTALRQTY